MTTLLVALLVAAEPPSAIPPAQLVRAATAAYVELDRIAELAAPRELAPELAGLDRDVHALSSLDADSLPAEVLRLQEALQQVDDQVAERVQQLEKALSTSKALVETWRLTSAGLGEELPRAIAARAADVRDRAIEAERAVRGQFAAALELQDRLVALGLLVSVQQKHVEALAEGRTQELFDSESKPLWRAPPRPANLKHLLRAAQGLLSTAAAYAAAEPVRIAIHLALAAGLIAAGIAITRRRRAAPPSSLSPSMAVEVVMKYPVESAALIALFTTPVIHPQRPPAVMLVVNLLALWPVLRIAGMLAPQWKAPLRIAAALLVTERLIAFAPEAGLLARLALLGVSVLAAAACLMGFRRDGWLRRVDAGKWDLPIRILSGIAAATFSVSAVANVAGNVNLGELLAGGVLAGVLRAAACAAVVVAVSGAARSLIELPSVRSVRVVRDYGEPLLQRTRRYLNLAVAVAWLWLMLRLFNASEPASEAAGRVLAWRLKVGGLDLALSDVVAFAITLWISVLLARALRFVLDEAVLPSMDVARGSAAAISTTARYAVVAIGFVCAVLAAGVEMTRFTVLAGTLGVGIGFGLQNVVNNFVAGLILLYERPIQVGDLIELEALTGEVTRIGVRSSTVRTGQGADVIVPNSNLISTAVVNWTATDRRRRIDIPVSVSRSSHAGGVQQLLLEIARKCAAVQSSPPPEALFTGYGRDSYEFELRVWTGVDSSGATASVLRSAINEALPPAGFALATPQLDLWVKSVPMGPIEPHTISGLGLVEKPQRATFKSSRESKK